MEAGGFSDPWRQSLTAKLLSGDGKLYETFKADKTSKLSFGEQIHYLLHRALAISIAAKTIEGL